MPRNLPIRNCRRFTGLLISVTAVPTFDLLTDRHARRQYAEQHRGEHDDVEADLLHHLVVVAEREVRQDDRQPDQDAIAPIDDEPEHRLPARFAVRGESDRTALGPEQHNQVRAAAGTVR